MRWPGFEERIRVMNVLSGCRLVEVPLSKVRCLGREFCLGGGFLRHFSYIFVRKGIDIIAEHHPAVLYFHPYEIDTNNRQFALSNLAYRQKLYALVFHGAQIRNRRAIQSKISRLLSEYRFTKIESLAKTFIG